MFDKPADSAVPLHPLLALRWSGRALDADTPVAPEAERALLEAARWAPSAGNRQPWRFAVFERQRESDGWSALLRTLARGNQAWAWNARLLIVVCAVTALPDDGGPNRWAAYDCGAAGVSLMLEARALGLMAHAMGGFDVAEVKALLGLKGDAIEPLSVIAVGHPADAGTLGRDLHAKELAPRRREPLDALLIGPGRRG
ncbi:nitroreductase family protein [Derxia gummosa]|uniref:Nitroreductase family protein n=1 Tax=Derxia gummosa DSM 723 TaxID=1121388 RepID=A0A8B6X490_9BURK|nr:nitroreductase family protein [Derxia gummosa]